MKPRLDPLHFGKVLHTVAPSWSVEAWAVACTASVAFRLDDKRAQVNFTRAGFARAEVETVPFTYTQPAELWEALASRDLLPPEWETEPRFLCSVCVEATARESPCLFCGRLNREADTRTTAPRSVSLAVTVAAYPPASLLQIEALALEAYGRIAPWLDTAAHPQAEWLRLHTGIAEKWGSFVQSPPRGWPPLLQAGRFGPATLTGREKAWRREEPNPYTPLVALHALLTKVNVLEVTRHGPRLGVPLLRWDYDPGITDDPNPRETSR